MGGKEHVNASKTPKTLVQVPNRLIQAGALSFSARRVGAVLYSRRNRLGACKRSLAYLARQAHCSVTTVRKALEELEDAKYITRTKNRRFIYSKGLIGYDQYTYHCVLGVQKDFTFIPWDLFGPCLKSCAFVLCLYLYQQAGNSTRAFPILKRMCREIGMSIATVCRALDMLEEVGRIYAQFCIKTNKAFSNNSYFFLIACSATPETSNIITLDVSDCMSAFPQPYCAHACSCWQQAEFGIVSFPCSHYTSEESGRQAYSASGGTLKTGKPILDLDNVGFIQQG